MNIISILLIHIVAALAFIFWLSRVLKNTCDTTKNMTNGFMKKTAYSLFEAYDGKYYPATAIIITIFNSAEEGVLVDFSQYETNKTVGFTICEPKSIEDFYGIKLEEEEKMALEQPVILEDVVVYSPAEGVWAWKSAH